MSTATVRVPAKINLHLGVGPRREDGFHSLATVYHAIDVYDEVRATARDDGEVTVEVHVEAVRGESMRVPDGEDNLAVRAALLLAEHTGTTRGVDLMIRKVIPVAGGLAGGSADAAAALVACAEVWGLRLGRHDLEPLAAELGSDVAFLLHGGTAIGSGRGEVVSPVMTRGSYSWVLAVFAHGLSTAEVYAEFDRLAGQGVVPEPEIPDTLFTDLRHPDGDAPPSLTGGNDLTGAALSLRPELGAALDVGRSAGALAAFVSGSGPTVVLMARDDTHAMDLSVALTGARVCTDVIKARGPVPGARLI